jgi:hypothetical protein
MKDFIILPGGIAMPTSSSRQKLTARLVYAGRTPATPRDDSACGFNHQGENLIYP